MIFPNSAIFKFSSRKSGRKSAVGKNWIFVGKKQFMGLSLQIPAGKFKQWWCKIIMYCQPAFIFCPTPLIHSKFDCYALFSGRPAALLSVHTGVLQVIRLFIVVLYIFFFRRGTKWQQKNNWSSSGRETSGLRLVTGVFLELFQGPCEEIMAKKHRIILSESNTVWDSLLKC